MAPVAPLFHPLPSYADAAGLPCTSAGGTPHPMVGRAISVPLALVKGGLSRLVAETFQRRPGRYSARTVQLPKLTVQISDVWVADNRYAGGSVGVLPPVPRERQGSATSSPQVGSINVQRCVGAGNLLTCDLSTSRRPARGHGDLAEDTAVRCRNRTHTSPDGRRKEVAQTSLRSVPISGPPPVRHTVVTSSAPASRCS